MKTITTYAEATSYIESLKALRKELHKQDKEVKEALMASEPKLETEGKEG